MRDETRRRLDRKLRAQRMKRMVAGILALGVVAGGLWISGLDATVTTHRVAGVVEAVGPLVGAKTLAIEQGLSVDVKLDDGRLVHLTALKIVDPHVGDHVQVAEHVHGTGRVTYSWR